MFRTPEVSDMPALEIVDRKDLAVLAVPVTDNVTRPS